MSERIDLSFKPKEIVKRLLSILTKRGQDILISRYGLGSKTAKFTLDAIGKRYGITRERVRQIENHSLLIIRKSKVYKDLEPVFAELKKVILDLGGIISEKDLNEKYKNEEVIKRWFSISHKIDKNPLGEWGRASSSNVNAKGMRDYA